MARLRYNLVESTLSADIDEDDASISLTIPFEEGGVDIPTFSAPDTLTVRVGSEIMTVTSYTSGALTAPVDRGQEDTLPAEHFAGDAVKHVITKEDFSGGGGGFSIRVAADDSTDLDKDKADFICTGSNDETVFQTIIDAYGTGARLDIMVAYGTYAVEAAIDVDCAASVSIVGPTADLDSLFWYKRPFFDKAAGNFSMFNINNGGEQVTFAGLYISNENIAESVASALIEVFASNWLHLRNCVVYSWSNTAGAAVELAGNSAHLEADFCDIESGDFAAIKLGSFTTLDMNLRHCYLYSDANTIEGLTIGGGCEFYLDDCLVEGFTALRLDGNTSSSPTPKVRLIDCYLEAAAGEAAYLTDIAQLYIDGGTYEAVSGSLLRLSNVDFGVISGVRSIYADNHGFWLLDCDDVLIEGCHLTGYANGTAATYSGIILDGNTNNCTVRDNKLRQDAVLSTAGAALYGIRVDDSTCDDNLVENNDLLGSCTTNGNEFSDAGTGTRGWLERELHFFSGNLVAGTASARRQQFARPAVLGVAFANVDTAPTGSTAIFDVNKNGTSIFATTPANRPTVAISGFAATSGAPDTKYMAAGDYLTTDTDQHGSTIAGANAVILQRYMPI